MHLELREHLEAILIATETYSKCQALQERLQILEETACLKGPLLKGQFEEVMRVLKELK